MKKWTIGADGIRYSRIRSFFLHLFTVNFTLGLCKPEGAPKYIRVGHFMLLELAKSCANPSKTRSSTLSPCMLTVAVKTVVCSSYV